MIVITDFMLLYHHYIDTSIRKQLYKPTYNLHIVRITTKKTFKYFHNA